MTPAEEQEISRKNKEINQFMSPNQSNPFLSPFHMAYHTSYNCMMTVVDKIEFLHHPQVGNDERFEVVINGLSVKIKIGSDKEFKINTTGKTKREAIYEAIFLFAEWYNKEKTWRISKIERKQLKSQLSQQ